MKMLKSMKYIFKPMKMLKYMKYIHYNENFQINEVYSNQ